MVAKLALGALLIVVVAALGTAGVLSYTGTCPFSSSDDAATVAPASPSSCQEAPASCCPSLSEEGAACCPLTGKASAPTGTESVSK